MRGKGLISMMALMGALGFLGLPSCEKADREEERVVVVGDLCPALSVVDLSGGERAFPVTGRPSLLFLYTSGCPDCQEQFPAIEELYRRYGDRVEFLGLTRGWSGEEAAAFLREKGYTLPVAPDKSGALFALFASQGVPRVYILRNDRVVFASDERSLLSVEEGMRQLEGLLPFFD